MNRPIFIAMLLMPLATCVAADPPGLLDVRVSEETVRGVKGIRVVPADGGEPLVEPNGQALFAKSDCRAEYELQPAAGGFDLQVTVENTTGLAQRRPAFWLRGVNLGTKFTYLDGRDLGHVHEAERKRGEPIFYYGMQYPEDLYAPVAMMHNDRFAIGMSLIYDVLTARHGILATMHTEGGSFFGTSGIGFDLHAPAGAYENPRGRTLLEPETTEHYRIAVRFARPANWLAALEPYREFFRKTYGGVRYRADLRPVYGETMALTKFLDAEANPRGYHPNSRYDQLGWKPMVDMYMQKAVANGYRRVMIWCASGLYRKGRNYPPEFMTEWPEKLVETVGELGRLRKAGVTVGHWWGRAGEVSGGWNSGRMWPRDMGVAADVEAGLAELRLAAARGTDEVGLDAVQAMPLCQRLGWMRRIAKDFPTMRFITESSDCDIGHTLMPTFMTFDRQPQAPVLADWLNPGHESWIMLRWQDVNQSNFDRITGWGCVPVTMSVPVKHDAGKLGRGASAP